MLNYTKRDKILFSAFKLRFRIVYLSNDATNMSKIPCQTRKYRVKYTDKYYNVRYDMSYNSLYKNPGYSQFYSKSSDTAHHLCYKNMSVYDYGRLSLRIKKRWLLENLNQKSCEGILLCKVGVRVIFTLAGADR